MAQTTSIRLDDESEARIDHYQERFGLEDRSATIREMIAVAHRETRSPLLYRIKSRGTDAAFYFALGAIVSIIIGVVTPALPVIVGVQIGIIFMAVGVGALAAVEFLRTLNGESDLGALLREVAR